jgi:hypothetical protein
MMRRVGYLTYRAPTQTEAVFHCHFLSTFDVAGVTPWTRCLRDQAIESVSTPRDNIGISSLGKSQLGVAQVTTNLIELCLLG